MSHYRNTIKTPIRLPLKRFHKAVQVNSKIIPAALFPVGIGALDKERFNFKLIVGRGDHDAAFGLCVKDKVLCWDRRWPVPCSTVTRAGNGFGRPGIAGLSTGPFSLILGRRSCHWAWWTTERTLRLSVQILLRSLSKTLLFRLEMLTSL